MTAALTTAALVALALVALVIWRRDTRRGAVAEDDAEEARGDAEKRSKVTDALGQRRTRR